MRFLTDSEWMLVNSLVLKINSIDEDPEFRRRILLDLRVLIPYDTASFFLTDFSKNIGGEWGGDMANPSENVLDPVGVDTPLPLMLEYLNRFQYEDPLVTKGLPRISAVYLERDLFNDYDKQGDYYKRYLAEDDILSVLFFHEKRHLGFIGLHRHKGSDPFTDREVAILETIEPHLTNRLAKWRVSSNRTAAESAFLQTYRISEREAQVVRCIIEGLSNAEISQKLSISPSTVKKHLENIFKKTGTNSRMSLAALARGRNGKGAQAQ